MLTGDYNIKVILRTCQRFHVPSLWITHAFYIPMLWHLVKWQRETRQDIKRTSLYVSSVQHANHIVTAYEIFIYILYTVSPFVEFQSVYDTIISNKCIQTKLVKCQRDKQYRMFFMQIWMELLSNMFKLFCISSGKLYCFQRLTAIQRC